MRFLIKMKEKLLSYALIDQHRFTRNKNKINKNVIWSEEINNQQSTIQRYKITERNFLFFFSLFRVQIVVHFFWRWMLCFWQSPISYQYIKSIQYNQIQQTILPVSSEMNKSSSIV